MYTCCQIPIKSISAANQVTQVKKALAGGPWPFSQSGFCNESAAMIRHSTHENRKWVYVNISVHNSTAIAHADLLVSPQPISAHKTFWTWQVYVCRRSAEWVHLFRPVCFDLLDKFIMLLHIKGKARTQSCVTVYLVRFQADLLLCYRYLFGFHFLVLYSCYRLHK